jgi:hypothetical protein
VFPEVQLFPHTSFDDEVAFLREIMGPSDSHTILPLLTVADAGGGGGGGGAEKAENRAPHPRSHVYTVDFTGCGMDESFAAAPARTHRTNGGSSTRTLDMVIYELEPAVMCQFFRAAARTGGGVESDTASDSGVNNSDQAGSRAAEQRQSFRVGLDDQHTCYLRARTHALPRKSRLSTPSHAPR